MSISGKKPNSVDPATRNRPANGDEWRQRTDAGLDWLRRSIDVTGGQGSSHSWSPLFGWAKAYPETTGYLIETLLDYAALKQDHSLSDLAAQCANWLVSIQLPDGAFPGLLAGNKEPSVFNTAMILFGLAAPVEPPPAPPEGGRNALPMAPDKKEEAKEGGTELLSSIDKLRPTGSAFLPPSGGAGGGSTLERAVSWLISVLEPDFSWRRHAYVPGFTPSYYTRAVWGVLKANRILQNPEYEHAMRKALHFYAERILPNGAVRDWGFRPGKPAFTHTIAYTFEGFLESALLLNDKELIDKKILAGEIFLMKIQKAGGRTAGRYDEQWRGDYSFVCVTGNCQLSIFYHRLWEITGEEKFLEAARSFLAEIIDFQYLGKNKNRCGALPGSVPIWGPYLRFRYPNWGVKFFLDAMRQVYPIGQADKL